MNKLLLSILVPIILTIMALSFVALCWWVIISIAGSAIKIGLDDCESVYPMMNYFQLQMFC
jgi:hypothetical protein